MPTFKVTDPDTGRTVKLTGDSPPTEDELNQIFSQLQQGAPVPPKPEDVVTPEDELTVREQFNKAFLEIPGGPEVAEFGSAINRGVANLVDMFGPEFVNAGLATAGLDMRLPTLKEQKFIQEATTGGFVEPGLKRDILRTGGELVGPGAAAGQALRAAGKAIPAVQAAPTTLGQRVTQQLGAGTAGQDVTAAALSGAGLELGGEAGEAVGGETGRAIGETAGALLLPISGAILKETAKKVATPSAKKLLTEAAPTIDGLKRAARTVYGEIDDLGAVITGNRVTKLGNRLDTLAKGLGFNKRINPKVGAVLKEFRTVKDSELTVSELDVLRRVARNAAKDPNERELGETLVSTIDDFMDNLKPKDFLRGGGEVGSKYKDARQLWRRAKKSEMLEDVFERARNARGAEEQAIKRGFRSILDSEKKRLGFTKDELVAMKKVARSSNLEQTFTQLSKLGFSDNMLISMAGTASGGAAGAAIGVGGPVGAIAVPAVGAVSKKLAEKLVRDNARMANLIIRAGNDGDRIAAAYLRTTPKTERSAGELSELLLRPGVSLARLEVKGAPILKQNKKLIQDSVFLSNFIRKMQEDQKE